jgi:DNA-binding GntR family transcriptional regulator
MVIERLSPKTIRQQVYDHLRRMIISAEILPGQAMTIQGLANDFGVSVMPVREALWQLESEKVIVIESNKRIQVNTLTAKEMQEAMELRLLLEPRAAELACERITDKDLPKVAQLLDQLEAALEEPKRFVFLNSQFHFAIYSFADSPMLLDMIDSLWARVGPYVNVAWEMAEDKPLTIKIHADMYEALAARDKGRLGEWLCTDLKRAGNVMVRALENLSATISERRIAVGKADGME